MQRPLFLLHFALLAQQILASFSGNCGERYPSPLHASLAANQVGAHIDAGAELTLDQYPYDLSIRDRRFFRALVRRVLRGCNELEKYEHIVVAVPSSTKDVIGEDGGLAFDVLFGSITSMTFPIQGTTQVLVLEDACQAFTMSEISKQDRIFLRDEGAKCIDRYSNPGLRG